MPIRKHKKYARPRKLFDKAVIKEEQNLIKKYGLKNRREVWRASYAISRIRKIAKSLITADSKAKEGFVNRQIEKGFPVSNIAEILGLSKEDLLKRRLQSLLVKNEMAKTHKQARQRIVHKHVSLNGSIIDSPSHLTTLKEEKGIRLNLVLPEKKVISDEERELLNKMKIKDSGEKNE